MVYFIKVNEQIINLSSVKRVLTDKKRLTITFDLGGWEAKVTKKCNSTDHFEEVFNMLIIKLEALSI